MAVHPIEYRYGRAEVKRIFDEETKLGYMLNVEAALAFAHAKVGNIPQQDAEIISKKANTKDIKLSRVKQIEDEIHHDIMAVVRGLSEQCGSSGEYVHLGATSNDILDTMLALQLKEYSRILYHNLMKLKEVLLMQAKKHKKTVCIGRTHGQHAIPTTYGLKFAIWVTEVERHLTRLDECGKRILVGKMSGAVGTQSALGEHAIKIQEHVMKQLGLESALVSNQVLQRDRLAEFMLLQALIAGTLEKIGVEIRNLQRTEIGEVSEGFRKKQVGSSTMPHKRNPIYAERICGISRVVQVDGIASLRNIPLWHERDLTNSSCERIIVPEACVLLDYILTISIDLLENLVFNFDKIEQNLNMSGGRIMAESVMIQLAEKGYGRQNAHALARKLAMESFHENKPYRDVLLKDKVICKYFAESELDKALDPKKYIGTAVEQVDLVLKKLG